MHCRRVFVLIFQPVSASGSLSTEIHGLFDVNCISSHREFKLSMVVAIHGYVFEGNK